MQRLLGMMVHGSYLNLYNNRSEDDSVLDVENYRGERYQIFILRLFIDHKDIALGTQDFGYCRM